MNKAKQDEILEFDADYIPQGDIKVQQPAIYIPPNLPAELEPEDVVRQVRKIQEVMEKVMRKDEHYGKPFPSAPKPTLLKPGAEKLGLTFRLAPKFRVQKTEMGAGHREYEVLCSLRHIVSGAEWGDGVGMCSTMEAKYRYIYENTGKAVPKEYWDERAPEILGGKEYKAKKTGKMWQIFKQVENDNPADFYNTVLKMAKKRAHVDAILSATAASDIFTQDLEDLPPEEGAVDTWGKENEKAKTTRRKKADEKVTQDLKDSVKQEGSKADLNEIDKDKAEEKSGYFKWLERMGKAKEKISEAQAIEKYYDVLGHYGYEKSNQVPSADKRTQDEIIKELLQVYEDVK